MAYNGSGVWNRLYNWTNDAANGIKIRADRMDAEFNDMCNNGLSAVVTRDGQGVPTANIPMGNHKLTGLAAGTASGDAICYAQAGASLAGLTLSAALTYGGVALSNSVTGTGSMVLSANPTFSGTANFAAVTTSAAATVGTDLTVGNGAAVHTTLGGWSGTAIFEALSGGNSAVSAYNNGPGSAFLGRSNRTDCNFATWYYGAGTPSVVGSISTNGSSVAYNTTSDARLKTNVQSASDAGELIDSIPVDQFDWKGTGERVQWGFIAQKLHALAPFAVTPGDDHPEAIEAVWQIDPSKLVGAVIKEVQSLRLRIAQLESAR